jgi:hypothetical protein
MSCQQPATSLPLKFLIQNPKYWRSKHREFLHVTEENEVPLERIVDVVYLPTDGDQGTEGIATSRCQEHVR